ncbi:protein NLRC3-like [Aplochiton taeniatus]
MAEAILECTVVVLEQKERPEVPRGQSAQHHLTDLAPIFTLLEESGVHFLKTELKRIQRDLRPECLESQRGDEEVTDGEEEEEQRSSAREGALKITLHLLRNMKQQELADTLENSKRLYLQSVILYCIVHEDNNLAGVCWRKLKANLKRKFECVFEGIAKEGESTFLNQIYTEVCITEGGNGEVTTQHEVRQIETASRKPLKSESIRINDIFKPPPGRARPIRTVLTKGVAGIGNTVSTQKFTLDWAEGKANTKFHFTFTIPFRELNLLQGNEYSLNELIHRFFVETKESRITNFQKYEVVFVFDGLDECRLPLDFENNQIWTDVTEPTSVDVLLTNLIKGNLLPSAKLWITTRPAAANQIPPECVDMVTVIRGFTDPQMEEYFMKRFRDKNLASRIISHVKTSRSLHIMCHIPVFCLITAKVLEHMLTVDQRGELPKTLTEMYIHFLVFQSIQGNVKYHGITEADSHWNTESRKMIMSLGKLAFQQLEKGNLIFYEADLTKCGFDVRAASVCSGVFTQFFKEERGLYKNKVFYFVHVSVQEFLAALFVFLSFFNSNQNVLSDTQKTNKGRNRRRKLSEEKSVSFYQCAVDKALQSENGHWDLFLRFLLGLSTNQTLLRGLLKQTGSSSETDEKTAEYIKEKIQQNLSLERRINLFHCLNELNDHSLVTEIQQYLESGSLSSKELSPAQWSALVFVLLTSEEEPDVFELKKYSASEEGLQWLLPVVQASTTTLLSECNLSAKCCEELASVLKSSDLRVLDLSNNVLQDSGVEHLAVGLCNPLCKLETLRLSVCSVTALGCASLASALRSNPSHLRELDLSHNDLGDSGVELLSAELNRTNCKLETLRLSGCQITEKGFSSLASALKSNPSHLRELDLSYNSPGNSGVKLLIALLEDPHCRLERLRIADFKMVNDGGDFLIKTGPRKYAFYLTLDVNTAHRYLSLSEENRKVTWREDEQAYPDHPERFDYWPQVLCSEGLTGSRRYWEVEWTGWVSVGVTYRGINRKGRGGVCCLGTNDTSWRLLCWDGGYTACHNRNVTDTPVTPSGSARVGVYLDCPAGTLSFYRVSSDTLTLIHTFHSTFTEPLYPGFWIETFGSSVSLCQT